jgi:hypothetical protein
MHGMLRTACVAAVASIACNHAHAAEKILSMTIDFVGDWCFDSQEDKNISWYTLPSWTEGGICTKILSINKYRFYFLSEKRNCEPVKVRLEKSVAASGTAYTATITARCQPDGPVTAGELQTFEFYRYKGRLKITTK